jgi:hypothetical protein
MNPTLTHTPLPLGALPVPLSVGAGVTGDQSVVATYATHEAAELAIRALQKAGIDMKKLSIVGKDFHTEEQAVGFYTSGDRIRYWGRQGVFWGSLWGVLFGSAFFFIPAIGPLVVMGPLAGWILGALEGAAVGGATGALTAALTGIGLPKDSVVQYELAVNAGQYLVLAHGSPEMIALARNVLGLADMHPTTPMVMPHVHGDLVA